MRPSLNPSIQKRKAAVENWFATKTFACLKCGTKKLGAEFYVHYDRRPDMFRLALECKGCVKARTDAYVAKNRAQINENKGLYYRRNRARQIRNAQVYRERNIERIHKWTIKRLYGLSEQDHGDMLKRQKGVCAICMEDPSQTGKRLQVDHDHKTGFVRGLLCGICNSSLRLIEDDTLLTRAIGYIERSQNKQKEITSGSSAVLHRTKADGNVARCKT